MHEPLRTVSGRGVPAHNTLADNWRNRKIWPPTDPDYVFMGEAIDLLGKELFGPKWTGTEPGGPALPALPTRRADATEDQRLMVIMETPRTREAFRHGEFIAYKKGDTIPDLTDEEWEAAVSKRDAKIESTLSANERWHRLWQILDWPLKRDAIATLTWNSSFGFSPAPSQIWRTGILEDRARLLKLNPRAPADTLSSALEWIYFSRADLERFLSGLADGKVTADSVGERAISSSNAQPAPNDILKPASLDPDKDYGSKEKNAIACFLIFEHQGKRPVDKRSGRPIGHTALARAAWNWGKRPQHRTRFKLHPDRPISRHTSIRFFKDNPQFDIAKGLPTA